MTDDLPQLVQRLTERAKKLSGHIDECRDNAIDCNGVLQPNYEDEDCFEFYVPCSQCLSAGVSLQLHEESATALDTLTRALAEQQAETKALAQREHDLELNVQDAIRGMRIEAERAELAESTLTAAVREARAETEKLQREVNYQRARAVDAEARLAAESVRAASRAADPTGGV